MEKLGFLRVVLGSFYSKQVYRHVGSHEKGIRLGYLAMLLALLWLVSMARMWWDFSLWTQGEAKTLVDQIPQITIRNGVVSTDVETPYHIENPPGDTDPYKYFAVIDLTGQSKSIEDVDSRLLLTERTLIARKSAYETRVFDLSGVEYFQMDKNDVYDWLGIARLWFVPVLFPFFFGFSLAYRLVQVVIYGAAGMGLAKVAGAALPYAALVRLSVVAITPVLIVDAAFDLLEISVPLWWLMAFAMAMAFLYFGITSNRVAASVPPPLAPVASGGTAGPAGG